jgi:hypothetical protein
MKQETFGENAGLRVEVQKALEAFWADKPLLRIEDVSDLLECDARVIMNWTKRIDPKRRPPRLLVGKEIRFPTRAFCIWLSHEQLT